MLKEHILNRFKSHFIFEPTPTQAHAMIQMAEFLGDTSTMPLFLLKGFAGTGKTALVAAFVKTLTELNIKTVLLAPTGRAAKVLSSFVGQPAYTIHKKIYRQNSGQDGFGSFNLNQNLSKDTIFIVDEASMVSNESFGNTAFGSGRLLDDLISFVYAANNCRLLLLGDTAQLPPVGLTISPALDGHNLQGYGAEIWEDTLTDVLRQEQAGGILKNATYLRSLLDDQETISQYPTLETNHLSDIHRLAGNELMEELSRCYNTFGMEETLVVCRTNKRANLYNQGIRNSILTCEAELTAGDYLLVMKNNYHWLKDHDTVSFIANGDIARIVRIKKYYDLYGYRFADISCQLTDYQGIELDVRIILDSLSSESAGLSMEVQEQFFQKVLEDYADVSPKKKQYQLARENGFYNALQVKFAYAMTCHKAQGGQWKAVFIDLGYFTQESISREFVRWLYTAVTRATEQVYLVNFPEEFFASEKK
jgi:exodeoxyribonuclease V